MAAYVIYARRSTSDEEKSREYTRLVVPQIHKFGGEIVTGRAKVHVLEGAWQPSSVTILKFASRQALMAWYESPEYAPLKQMRQDSNIGDFVVVEDM